MHDKSVFVTLTYDDDHVSSNYSLVPQDFTRFMKRLRKYYNSETIRYFQAGEYGELLGRPHHHAILFGIDFIDKQFKVLRNEHKVYSSLVLDNLWTHGMTELGSVTFESAAYVARYCVSKVYGDSAKDYYGDRVPPYVTMSRRPGIGATWYRQYRDDVYNYDNVILRGGIRARPPKYYDKLLEREDSDKLEEIKLNREEMDYHVDRPYSYRLMTREKVQELRSEKLLRRFE